MGIGPAFRERRSDAKTVDKKDVVRQAQTRILQKGLTLVFKKDIFKVL